MYTTDPPPPEVIKLTTLGPLYLYLLNGYNIIHILVQYNTILLINLPNIRTTDIQSPQLLHGTCKQGGSQLRGQEETVHF